MFHVLAVFIEGVDDKLPVDGHRLSPLLVAEHDPAAESSLGRFALRVANGIGPHVGHQDGDSRLGWFVVPGEPVGQIELGTAGEQTQDEQTAGPKRYTEYTLMVHSWHDFAFLDILRAAKFVRFSTTSH